MSWTLPGGARLEITRGDLTHEATDAIVNAANPAMLGGGGVDGAIHRAAGPKLLLACRKHPPDGFGRRCPPGEARVTPGFELPARWVIHTVGPVYERTPEPERVLADAYRHSVEAAAEVEARTIAFPAISCGAYGYPWDEAAEVALDAVADAPLDLVRFVHFGAGTWQAWVEAADARFPRADEASPT